MARLLSRQFLILLFALGAGFGAAGAAAAEDPGMHQVYEAANSGHLDQARTMMSQVLKDHPDSAKAHYVASEIDARSGDFASARSEFQTAERLAPGLPFAKPGAVQALRNELYPQQRERAAPVGAVAPAGGRSGFPWGAALGIGFVVWIVWLIFRRRQQAMAPGYGAPMGPAAGGYGGGYPGGYPPPAGGGLLGSLGTGLAVGAGVVAGEELAHRLLDGNGERVVERNSPVVYNDPGSGGGNADMGGNDFGVNDSASWDDGGSIGGGGGDDSWS